MNDHKQSHSLRATMTLQNGNDGQDRQPLLGEAAKEDVPDQKRAPPLCALTAGTAAKGNDTESQKTRNKLILALVLCFVFMIVEVAGGIVANSLAVLTDAAHLLSDVSGFAIALFANFVASQSNKETHTFGYHRVEVLGALVSVLSTWLVTGILLWEAVLRVQSFVNHEEVEVNGRLMFILAMVGVLVNALNFFVLGHHGHSHSHGHEHDHDHDHSHDLEEGHAHDDHDHDHNDDQDEDQHHDHGDSAENINLKGAVLHVIGDLVQSIGVAVAGLVIWIKSDDHRWRLADPICTFFFAILVLLTTRVLLRDIADILMERVPRGQNAQIIQEKLEQVEGVDEVHDLHVWALTPGIPLLAVHLNVKPGFPPSRVLLLATEECRKLKIKHSTIQVISHGEECCGANLSHSYPALYGSAGEERSELSQQDGHHRHSHGSEPGHHKHHGAGSSHAGHTHKHNHQVPKEN